MSDSILSISFCTTAMGRFDHLLETFLRNIDANSDYPRAEFVLLDYGSPQPLCNWVKSTDKMMELIRRRRLVYLRLDGIKYYSHSHSRNVAFLASSGEVFCNIDADNFTPKGFAFHVNELMNRSALAMASYRRAPTGGGGRVAIFRRHFLRVGGYDESFVGWGVDDRDLRARLVNSGCIKEFLDPATALIFRHARRRCAEHFAPNRRNIGRTSYENLLISEDNLACGRIVANAGKSWGVATLQRNFVETVRTGICQASHNTKGSQSIFPQVTTS